MLRSLAVLVLAGFAASAAAQDNYPSRQITLIAPFAAGGSTDLVARVVSEGLRAKLGQPVIVENKPAGTGIVGAREVVKAAPDGYMLLLANSCLEPKIGVANSSAIAHGQYTSARSTAARIGLRQTGSVMTA
jgi:tripartite-type tricarboxylate transporter receptor subunit TctC